MPAAGIRGFLDASEFGTWLKHFQSSNKMDKHNIKHFLLAGQVRFDFCYLCTGQLISKANCQAVNSSKKRTNEFVFTTMRRVFVLFLEEIEDPFEIT